MDNQPNRFLKSRFLYQGFYCTVSYLCFTTEVWKSIAILLQMFYCSSTPPSHPWYRHVKAQTANVFGTHVHEIRGGAGREQFVWPMKKNATSENFSMTLFIYLFIYYFPTIKITQALHYTKMWRGDLRKPQGLYEEAPSLQ